jgi:hypothetical protein
LQARSRGLEQVLTVEPRTTPDRSVWLSHFSHHRLLTLQRVTPNTTRSSFVKIRRPGRLELITGIGLALSVTLAACGSGGANVNGSGVTTTTSGQAAPPKTSVAGSRTTVTLAPETPTPGDIPDTTAYVPYTNVAGGYGFAHPEGWAQTGQGTSVSFTDKYNGASASVEPGATAPTVGSAPTTEVPKLRAAEPAFGLISISSVTLPAGSGVLIVYRRNSPADPVTGRSVRQEVHRYLINGNHQVVALDLFGAVGADNVDPYAKMSQSLHF